MLKSRGASSDDDSSGRRLIGGAIFAALAASAIGLLYQAGYEQDAANARRDYSRNTQNQIANACIGVAEIHLVKCFSKARIEADLKENEKRRDEADLVAQRKSALWTTLMGVAAMIGMALSAAGVLLVWRTFRETQKTSKAALDANRITQHAQRPWIDITVRGEKLQAAANFIDMQYTVVIENIGKSVAERVSVHVAPAFLGADMGKKIAATREMWWHENIGPSSFTLMPGESYELPGGYGFHTKGMDWQGKKGDTDGLGRVICGGVIASVFYKLPDQSPLEDRKRTERFFKIGMRHEGHRMRSIWLFEDDLRTVEGEKVVVNKTRNAITT